MEADSVINYVRSKIFAILDCECIQISPDHQCVRCLYILCKDGRTSKYSEFYACKQYRELETRYKKAFGYCQKHIHHLGYNPRKTNSPHCVQTTSILHDFVCANRLDIILFKGGNIEKKLCNNMSLPALNIETLGVPKATSHDPRLEVQQHYNYLLNIGCMLK